MIYYIIRNSILTTLDNYIKGNWDRTLKDLNLIQKEIDDIDKKIFECKSSKDCRKNKLASKYEDDSVQYKTKLLGFINTNFIDDLMKNNENQSVTIKLCSRIIAGLISVALSIESIKNSIDKPTLLRITKVYNFCMGV